MTDSLHLPPRQQPIRSARWPVVGESQPARRDDPWTLTIGGLAERPQRWSLAELENLGWADYAIDIHCVTRWSKLDMTFTGLPLSRLLAAAVPSPAAEYASFVSRSERYHSSSMRWREAVQEGAIVAIAADRVALPEVHGGPLRLVVPGRYFYKSVKWLERIELLAEDRLGFWESTAGYHNQADPWLEQRYMAATVSRLEAAQLIKSRDFSGRDLRGISATRRDMAGLVARDALLRDADFRHARLMNANFQGANLSNAQLDNADLRGADFSAADVEGASFAEADLRGANLCVASLFGASFCTVSTTGAIERPARFDASTRWHHGKLKALTDDQLRCLRQSGVILRE